MRIYGLSVNHKRQKAQSYQQYGERVRSISVYKPARELLQILGKLSLNCCKTGYGTSDGPLSKTRARVWITDALVQGLRTSKKKQLTRSLGPPRATKGAGFNEANLNESHSNR